MMASSLVPYDHYQIENDLDRWELTLIWDQRGIYTTFVNVLSKKIPKHKYPKTVFHLLFTSTSKYLSTSLYMFDCCFYFE